MKKEYQIKLDPITKEEKAAFKVISELTKRSHEAYAVGGAIRDRLLEKAAKDVDVASSATPEVVARIFDKTVAVGEAFGVIIVIQDGVNIEVATFRSEDAYIDGRRPTKVEFSNPQEDASRRDFTINALFYDPIKAKIIDYTDGLQDLKRGIIRAIGNANERFSEDYLRMLRAIRFTAELNFELDQDTYEAIKSNAVSISRISVERIFVELSRMLTGKNPKLALELLNESGIFKEVLGELNALDLANESNDLSEMKLKSESLAWAILINQLNEQEQLKLLQRLKVSNELTKSVLGINRDIEILKSAKGHDNATLRPVMASSHFKYTMEYLRILALNSIDYQAQFSHIIDLYEHYGAENLMPPALLNGNDFKQLGVGQGKTIGILLRKLKKLQLNDKLLSKEEALNWAQTELKNLE